MHNYINLVMSNGLYIVLARWFAQPSRASVVALLLGLDSHTFVRDPTRRRTSKFFCWLNRGRSHNRWLYWLSCRKFRAVRVWIDGDCGLVPLAAVSRVARCESSSGLREIRASQLSRGCRAGSSVVFFR